MKTIAFIGNFIPPYSTENERKYAFEQLGHKVIPLQENQVTDNQLIKLMPEVDMLVYSHTHDPSYVIKNLRGVFDLYRENEVPTISVHLDRWLWLARQKDMGNEATWFTEHIFMADCSPEAIEEYDRLKLNWYYLKPGVAENFCYLAKPNHEKYPHKIIFTGSKGYHPEYPFRAELVDWLHETYGDLFGHYGNDGIGVVRMEDLNTLYASSDIVIGDSCFGGRPNYVSDRYYEVRGRGGFLVHPGVDGVDNKGVATYQHPKLDDLKRVIDYYLEHTSEREKMRVKGYSWVKSFENYTVRAKQIIDTVFNV